MHTAYWISGMPLLPADTPGRLAAHAGRAACDSGAGQGRWLQRGASVWPEADRHAQLVSAKTPGMG